MDPGNHHEYSNNHRFPQSTHSHQNESHEVYYEPINEAPPDSNLYFNNTWQKQKTNPSNPIQNGERNGQQGIPPQRPGNPNRPIQQGQQQVWFGNGSPAQNGYSNGNHSPSFTPNNRSLHHNPHSEDSNHFDSSLRGSISTQGTSYTPANNHRPSINPSANFTQATQYQGRPSINHPVEDAKRKVFDIKSRIKYLDDEILNRRRQIGLFGVDVSQKGIEEANKTLKEGEEELRYLSRAHEALESENKQNQARLVILYKKEMNSSATSLDGCEEMMKANRELKMKFKRNTMEFEKKLNDRVAYLEKKSTAQLENEAEFVGYKYSSDQESLKLDLKAYYGILKEMNSNLRDGGYNR